MSALRPKADMVQDDRDVRFVPKADIGKRWSFRGSRNQISGIDSSARRDFRNDS
jgi:hypothetical protein